MNSTVPSHHPEDSLGLAPHLRDLLLDRGAYRLRVAATQRDLLAACKLRFDVFNLEMGEGLQSSYGSGLDQDEFDAHCHHLLVEYGPDQEVVGTYRLQTADAARAGAGFYSANEFEIDKLPDGFVDESVELGRACIATAHRNRAVLLMLWKGLCAYIEACGKRYFFGCNSLSTQNTALGWATYRWLAENGHAEPGILIKPCAGWDCGDPAQADHCAEPVKIPPLFAAYMRYGSKICSEPALDREFGTIDFLTMHDLHGMDPDVLARFR